MKRKIQQNHQAQNSYYQDRYKDHQIMKTLPAELVYHADAKYKAITPVSDLIFASLRGLQCIKAYDNL